MTKAKSFLVLQTDGAYIGSDSRAYISIFQAKNKDFIYALVIFYFFTWGIDLNLRGLN
jgi:hypothetical protein